MLALSNLARVGLLFCRGLMMLTFLWLVCSACTSRFMMQKMVPVFEQLFDVGLTHGIDPCGRWTNGSMSTWECKRLSSDGRLFYKAVSAFLGFNGASNLLFLSEDTQHPFC